jgi:hypothetical protein
MTTVMEISDTDRGWIAATLTNKGSFTKNTVHKPNGKTHVYPRFEFYSTEEWVVDRLMLITGVGRKTFRPEPRATPEAEGYGMWRWSVAKQDEVRDLALEILPLLPPERRKDVLGVL